MSEDSDNRGGPRVGRAFGVAAAALILAAAFQPGLAVAEHAGGGSHSGGSHMSGVHAGGFHAGGFHGGGFHGGFAALHNGAAGGGFHGGEFHHFGARNGEFHRGFHGGNAGGLGTAFAPFAWNYYSPFYGDYGYYPDYSYYPEYGYYPYAQPYAGQAWYYCSDPAGYYPYVTQCYTGWQAVPAS